MQQSVCSAAECCCVAGVFPFGPIMAGPSASIYFPDQEVFALGASVLFWLPGYKHFMRWLGCLPASRLNLISLLQRGSVAVMVGGIAEMCAAAAVFVCFS